MPTREQMLEDYKNPPEWPVIMSEKGLADLYEYNFPGLTRADAERLAGEHVHRCAPLPPSPTREALLETASIVALVDYVVASQRAMPDPLRAICEALTTVRPPPAIVELHMPDLLTCEPERLLERTRPAVRRFRP